MAEIEREKFDIGIGEEEVGVVGKDGELIGNFVVFDPKTKMLKSIDENGNVVNIIVYEIREEIDENGETYTHTTFNPEKVDNRWKTKIIKREKEKDEGINSRSEILDL